MFGPTLADTPAYVISDADLDGDGDRDLTVWGGMGVCSALNLGGMSFLILPPVAGTQYGYEDSFAVSDLDNDGVPELVGAPNSVFSGLPYAIVIWRFVGGQWTMALTIPISENVGKVVTGDFDGDGFVDIGLPPPSQPGSPWLAQVRVLHNAGGVLSFSLQGPFPATLSMSAAASGDINNDGCDDIIGTFGGNVCVLL